MLDLLPESISNETYRDKHNFEYANSMNHIKMFKQYYDISRYTKQVYGDRFPQIEMSIPIKNANAITKEYNKD